MKKNTRKGKVGVGEIADILNISKSTVSRALNNHPKISDKTKERVKQVAIKLGYTPNIPDFMKPVQAKIIMIIVPEIDNSYYRDIIKGIESFFNETGYEVLISNVKNSVGQAKSLLELSKKLNPSGVILVVFNKDFPTEDLNELDKNAIPFVLIHQSDDDIVARKVIPDVLQGTMKATQHLIAYKNKRIALLLHSRNDTICSEMLSGYKSALQESGIELSEDLIKFRNTVASRINENLHELFSKDEFPDAVITRTPRAAFQSINYLKSKNLQVPDDVMVVSLGSEIFSSFCSPGIASIELNGKEIGLDASKLLFERIESLNTSPKTIIRPVQFIIKGSAMRRRKKG